jgi:hypothetical protein
VGLHENTEEYEENIQSLVRKLSFKLQHPVTAIKHNDKAHLVIKDDQVVASRVPSELDLIRQKVVLKPLDKTLFLDFENCTEETKEICLRFLNFDIQSQINRHNGLWQPGAGKPYFEKSSELKKDIAIYHGFVARVVALKDGFGIAVDTTQKYVSAYPLKSNLDKDGFKRYKGKHFVYHHQNWYDIKLEEFCDQTVSEYRYLRGDKTVSLIEDLRTQIRKPHPDRLANMSDDASVAFYRSNKGALMAVPVELCYQIYDTQDLKMKQSGLKPTLPPHIRLKRIRKVRSEYLNNLRFGRTTLRVDQNPISINKKTFMVPDFEFGNGVVLSLRGTEDATYTTINNLGKDRKNLIMNPEVGFYSSGELDRQVFVMPKSIADSMGKVFLESLKHRVNQMYPTTQGYDPQLITYDDRNERNYVKIGYAIISAVKARLYNQSGYGVVMIPEYKRRKREHDKLSALVVRELMDEGINVGIIHTPTVKNAYIYRENNGKPSYVIKSDKRGKLDGYTTNVAINKVLLTNEKWPFVLSTPLNADLTIGIDVKHHTAGFTFIGKYGKNIRTVYRKSKNKEKLKKAQVLGTLKKYITEEAEFYDYPIKNVVIHRDGRLFKTEYDGINEAIDMLRNEMFLPHDVNATILEIPKKSVNSVRLFEQNGNRIENPNIGSYFFLNNTEAFLCATGREFWRPGTTNPLYVKFHSGSMEFEKALQDVYSLTGLAFTRPEDCTRFPLTIKITDRKLAEVASEYDEETMEMLTELNIEIDE